MRKDRKSQSNNAPRTLIWKIIDENEVVFAIWQGETKRNETAQRQLAMRQGDKIA